MRQQHKKGKFVVVRDDTIASSTSGFDARKFNGIIKIDDDALAIQKALSEEWERNPDQLMETDLLAP